MIVPLHELKEHSPLWAWADLDTSFCRFEKSSPQPEIKVHLEIRFNLRSVCLIFSILFTEKPIFDCAFALPMILFLSYFVKTEQYGSRLCDMQISYEMVCNAHAHQVTVSL